jgi:iron complex outermembrane receptor protein
LKLQGAVRAEGVRIDGTPASDVAADRSFTPVSASAGFTYELTDSLRVGLTAASAARAPAQSELFARGPHDGPGTFEIGDPALGLERANSLEATARWQVRSAGRVEASLWGANFQDYIYGALTGRACDEAGVCALGGPGDLKELNYVQRDARFWGAEVKAAIPLRRTTRGELSANVLGDYVRARFANGGGDVPRIQPGRIGGGLSWSSETLDASLQVLAVAAQTHVGQADSPTKGYTDVGAQVAWRPWGSGRHPEFLLVGHNLADAEIRNATAFNKDEVVLPGRDVRVVVRTKF